MSHPDLTKKTRKTKNTKVRVWQLVLELEFPQQLMCYQWHFNSILLSDKEFVNLISSEITLFLEMYSSQSTVGQKSI